jgi:hypothetical protein
MGLTPHLCKTQSSTTHPPKGVRGHRRQKKVKPQLYEGPVEFNHYHGMQAVKRFGAAHGHG